MTPKKLTIGLVLLAAPAWAQQEATTTTFRVQTQAQKADDTKKADIYDTKADAKQLIAKAVAKAKSENTRVLVMFGGNWCGWCHKLHGTLKSDQGLARTML